MSEPVKDPLTLAWKDTLSTVEELMQLGLLQNLRGVRVIGISDGVLEIEASSEKASYLLSDAVRTHLLVLAKPCFEKYGLRLEDIKVSQG